VPVGATTPKKLRKFDLGCEPDALLVECKSHTCTAGGNTPSAKMTVWNESMYCFYVAPEKYSKVFFALKVGRPGITLASYHVANYCHLIPDGVEIWEYDFAADAVARLQ